MQGNNLLSRNQEIDREQGEMAGVVNMKRLFVLIMVLVVLNQSFKKAAGIDCIDINKQPAFDNPLLKSHRIQMKPSFIRREEKSVVLNSEAAMTSFKNVEVLLDELQECPLGTVPIPRTLKSSTKHEASEPNGIDQFPPLVRHYEVVETDDGNVHYGVKGYINVNNPSVESDQLSSAQIWVQSGPQEDLNLIEAGWAVYPRIFGDNCTRLYTSWSGIGGENKDCINHLCGGFVQVDRRMSLGIDFDHMSVYGGEIYVLILEIARDQQSGNWWLTLSNEETAIPVGYWPKELFNHLANNAMKVGFGAVTGAPANRPSPPMGNGYLPNVDLSKCGFIAKMKIIDKDGNENDVPAERVRIAGDKPPCYQNGFRGYVPGFEFTMSFGGPGGNCG